MMVGPQGETYIRGGGNTAVLNIPPSYQLLGLPLNYNKHHIIQQEANLFFVLSIVITLDMCIMH